MMDTMLSALRSGLPGLGVTIPDGADETLCKFGCELIEQNKVMNLTAITEQILKTCILRNGCAEVLTEGTVHPALEAVLRSIRLAVGEGMFHLLQTHFLSHREQGQQMAVSYLAVRLCVTVVLCIIESADILQKLGIHGAVLHTAKQISYIHFVSSCILDW